MSIFPSLENNQGLIAIVALIIALIGLYFAIPKKRINRKTLDIPQIKLSPQTIPFEILQYFSRLGFRYTFRWDKTSNSSKDDLHLPFGEKHKVGKLAFYCIDKHFINFFYIIASKRNQSKFGIEKGFVDKCLLSYAKGFNNGYFDYDKRINSEKTMNIVMK